MFNNHIKIHYQTHDLNFNLVLNYGLSGFSSGGCLALKRNQTLNVLPPWTERPLQLLGRAGGSG